MKSTKIDMTPERQLLTGMIVSDRFLREIRPAFRVEYLKTMYARIVAEWVIEYHDQYQAAPGKNIQAIYESKRTSLVGADEDDVENVSEFLARLSKDYEAASPSNLDYSLANSLQYLKLRSQELLAEQLQAAVKEGDPLKGEQALSNYKRPERAAGSGVSLLRDPVKVASAFMEEDELLFRFPGVLGRVCGDFNRGDFIAFLAPMKRGKTWWLWYLAECAMYSSCKVVFFTLEMTDRQMIRRSWQSLMAQPRKSGMVKLPRFEEVSEEGEVRYMVSAEEEKREGVDPSRIAEYQKVFRRRFRGGNVRIISLPAYSATPEQLEAHLDILEHYENFIPDVIITDYADIIAPPTSFRGEYRHQLDAIWKWHRGLAQKRNCLVATATQAAKSTLSSDAEGENVAEDIRKLAHVTCMLALNQTKAEKEQGIIRVSQIAVREGAQSFQQAVVLQCLDIGRPCLDSRYQKEVISDEPDLPRGKHRPHD